MSTNGENAGIVPDETYIGMQCNNCFATAVKVSVRKEETLYHIYRLIHKSHRLKNNLKTFAVNKVTNRWRNHNNKTTKISELNKIIELYEL